MLCRRVFPSEQLDDSCWAELSRELQTESYILKTRTDPESLRDAHASGFTVTFTDGNKIVGFICAWTVAPGFVEIGSAWVCPLARRTGLGNTLFLCVKDLPIVKTSIAFSITENPFAVKAGAHAGLVFHTNWNHPVPLKHTCGPCAYYTDAEKPNCPLRNNTCHLLMFENNL